MDVWHKVLVISEETDSTAWNDKLKFEGEYGFMMWQNCRIWSNDDGTIIEVPTREMGIFWRKKYHKWWPALTREIDVDDLVWSLVDGKMKSNNLNVEIIEDLQFTLDIVSVSKLKTMQVKSFQFGHEKDAFIRLEVQQCDQKSWNTNDVVVEGYKYYTRIVKSV